MFHILDHPLRRMHGNKRILFCCSILSCWQYGGTNVLVKFLVIMYMYFDWFYDWGFYLTHSFFMKQKNEYKFCMAMWFYVLHKNLSLNMQHYYTEFHRMSVAANLRDQHIDTVFVYGLFNDSVSSLDYVVLNNWINEYLIAIGYHFFKYRSQWAYMTYSRKVGITCITVKPHKF